MSGYCITPCRDSNTDMQGVPFMPMRLFAGKGQDAQFISSGAPPADVARITVDAARLSKPLVKMKFSGIVNFRGLAPNPLATLNFTLYRMGENGARLSLNSWVYETYRISDNAVPLTFETSFSFLYCDRPPCARCAEYYVEVSLDSLENASVTVTDVNIQAIAQ